MQPTPSVSPKWLGRSSPPTVWPSSGATKLEPNIFFAPCFGEPGLARQFLSRSGVIPPGLAQKVKSSQLQRPSWVRGLSCLCWQGP